jgi:putative membrane-bound dehydrogenase-like protein
VAAIRDVADRLTPPALASTARCPLPAPRVGTSWRRAACLLLICHALAGAACRAPRSSAAQDALSTFRLPDGFHLEIAAAEPDIQNPVAMAFDPRGRVFVVELPDYPLGEQPGRIKLLEDRDHDGRYETSTVFADNFHFPTGVLPWQDGVLVTAAPDIFYVADTDGDGRADVRRVVLTGFATTNPQLRVNGLLYGLDNWIYVSYPRVLQPQRYVREFGDRGSPIRFPDHPQVPAVDALSTGTDIRFKMDPPQLEAAAGNGQFGNAFDAWGNRFTVWNNDHLRHVVIAARYASANPHLAVRSTMQSISDHGNAASLFPITRDPQHVHESEIGHFTSACGISVAEGGTFPAPFEHDVFVCDPVHNVVHADRLTASGATFAASRALEGREFLASTDGWFRPVFSTTGPDGALYVVDFHRKLIEHPEWLPPEMMNKSEIDAGRDLGRIYRVSYGAPSAAGAPFPADSDLAQLFRNLAHPNQWWRTTSQELIVRRHDLSVVPALRAMALNVEGTSPVGRLHALWTLEGLGALEMDTVTTALSDREAGIREHAVRLAETYLESASITDRLLRMTDDPAERVQFQVACTLARVPHPSAAVTDALERVLLRHVEDDWFQMAVLTGANDSAAGWWGRLTARTEFMATRTAGKEALLRSIASIVGSRRDDGEVIAVLARVSRAGDASADWWTRAALDGVAAGLRHGAATPAATSARTQNVLLSLLHRGSMERRRSALEICRGLVFSNSPSLQRLLADSKRAAELESAPGEARASAVGILGLDPGGGTVPTLSHLLSPRQPEPVQLAAAAALLAMPSDAATRTLLEHWQEYTGAVRELVVAGFFSTRPRMVALLDGIESGKVKAASLERTRAARLRTYPDVEIRRRAAVLVPAGEGDDRAQALLKYRAALKLSGDAGRGRAIFTSSCTACHRLGGVGYEVGPDLSGVAGRDRENLLLQIVDPNASIVAGYEEYLIETADGRSITGVIAHKTDTAVIVRRGGGGEDTVLRSSIVRLRSLALSHMPEGLEASMTLQGMADLLQYLKTSGGGN